MMIFFYCFKISIMLRNASKLNDLRENFNKMMVDMIALEKEQEILKVENKRKRDSIDVNLDFIESWLEKTKELREYQETPEIERADFFKRHLLACSSRSHDPNHPQTTQLRQWIFKHYGPRGCGYSRDPGLRSCELRSQQIMENIDSIKILEKQTPTNHLLSNTPSSSFIQFVESTFNLFTQLTERIKVLEKKIENRDTDLL